MQTFEQTTNPRRCLGDWNLDVHTADNLEEHNADYCESVLLTFVWRLWTKSFKAEALVRSQTILCGIYGEPSGSGASSF
jgi:hypothetical protein